VAAAGREIRTGEIVPVKYACKLSAGPKLSSLDTSLPLNVPNQPAFGREVFKHEIKTLAEGYAYDDLYTMNTQSGTQWDGFRHFAHMSSGSFYNGVRSVLLKLDVANN
jgi:hypothetical protein